VAQGRRGDRGVPSRARSPGRRHHRPAST
jgi:hypothetical protein